MSLKMKLLVCNRPSENNMRKYPVPIEEFLRDLTVIRGRSQGTATQYGIDLDLLFRYVYCVRNSLPTEGEKFENLDISGLGYDFVKEITRDDILDFLKFVSEKRDNKAKTRARKLSSFRAFFKYHCINSKQLTENPAENIDSPKISKKLPKFLSGDESVELLEATRDSDSRYKTRNYCIITLFLNCGMRLSELVGMNLSDFDKDFQTVIITGKGSKERIIYLNEACRESIAEYLKVRPKSVKQTARDAFFLSSRGKRISKQMVQTIVYDSLKEAGLSNRGLSTHKLRHTAATLMYQTGKVDIRVLKDILGHEQLNTTQIYTHLSNSSVKAAMDSNPLANFRPDEKKENEQ